jgi:hypothetical protein
VKCTGDYYPENDVFGMVHKIVHDHLLEGERNVVREMMPKPVGTSNPWREIEFELPPDDGFYICSGLRDHSDSTTAYYDGHGFKDGPAGEVYYAPFYWKNIEVRVKRYGKQIRVRNGQLPDSR